MWAQAARGPGISAMPQATSTKLNTSQKAKALLHGRLRERQPEIEAAVLTRVFAVADLSEVCDPDYVEGVRAAVPAAIDYGLAAVLVGERRSPPPPPPLLAQARLAARASVSLDTVLRRYFAGHVLLSDFIVEEAERDSVLSGSDLQRLLRAQAALLERIVAAVSEEHGRESGTRLRTTEERRAERVDRLLAGELIDASEIPYDFEGHRHVAMIATGPGATQMMRELARALDRRLLTVEREGEVWAWLGGTRALDPGEVQRQGALLASAQVRVALGEPAQGLAGWRLSHRQARAALPIALRGSEPLVRYAEVAMLAAVLGDELLAGSLRELYLEPLEAERDGGEALRETLRAYFGAQGNITCAATVLGTKRQTVAKRLRTVEERLGREVAACAAEIEAALALEELIDDQHVPSL
jgi:diguanylate cyclase with GGDEF domain/PucR-like helix-turn-helix protein